MRILPRILMTILVVIAIAVASGCNGGSGDSKPDTMTIKVIETTDEHGSLFPYDFIENAAISNSVAQIYTYVKEQRAIETQEVILLSDGDILQGQPIVNFYNFEKDLTQGHIVPQVMNYMGYDAGTVGNHDIEPGKAVYDAVNAEMNFPWLSANTIKTADGQPYFKPYTIIERQGVKIAVFGLTTPGIPKWLPQSVWEGMDFEDMVECAKKWMPTIRAEEPDVVIGLFHSGFDYTYGGTTADTPKNENACQLVAQQVEGFDLICMGHDHMNHTEVVNGVTMIGAKNAAVSVATATINLTMNEDTGTYDVAILPEIVDPTSYEADAEMIEHFTRVINETKAYASEEIGTFTQATSSRDAMFGDSSFNDLIHSLQISVSENVLGTRAEISFAAPLQFDKTISTGPVTVGDMYKLYKYENAMYLMTLSGEEVRNFLEYSYEKWMNTMTSADDHLINFTSYDPDTGQYSTATRYYNYDSAAGIVYTVDVSKPAGERVTITGVDANLDGVADEGVSFDPAKTYVCAINSYRGGGGGGHLLGAGLTEDEVDNETRKIAQTERDLRYYLMEDIRAQVNVTPAAIGHWSVVPLEWATAGAARDRAIFYTGEGGSH